MWCGRTASQQNNRDVNPLYFKLKCYEFYWVEGERVSVIAGAWIWWCPAGSLWLVAGWGGTRLLRSLGSGGMSLGRGVYPGWAGCSHLKWLVVSVVGWREVVLGLLALLGEKGPCFFKVFASASFWSSESIWPESFIFLQRRVPILCCGLAVGAICGLLQQRRVNLSPKTNTRHGESLSESPQRGNPLWRSSSNWVVMLSLHHHDPAIGTELKLFPYQTQ